ncbi:MAG: hypothetical protein AAF213_05775 [Pseudomonadota bacterium]
MANKSIIMPADPGSVAALQRDIWDRPDIRKATNCYAFAANDPFDHPGTNGPQPGDRHFSYLREISVKEVRDKAITDGFLPIDGHVQQKPGHYVVALAVAPHGDYHWYRQMDDGTWWHKPGPGKAITNRDYNGDIITDPRTANRRNSRFTYKDFGGFFHVPNQGLRVGITPDRARLRDFEIQEIIEKATEHLAQRSQQVKTSIKADKEEYRRRKAEINQRRPRNKLQAWARGLWGKIEDQWQRLTNRPLRPRLDPDGALEAISEEMADKARRRDRQCRLTEMRQLRDLITSQERRARSGWRPTAAMLRYKIERHKGQRHSFVIAADVYSGSLNYTARDTDQSLAANSNDPAGPKTGREREPKPGPDNKGGATPPKQPLGRFG